MTLEQVISQVLHCSITEIDDNTSTRTMTSWDSLRHIEVVMELEEAFGVAFPPMQAAAMTSVGVIRRVLQQNGIKA